MKSYLITRIKKKCWEIEKKIRKHTTRQMHEKNFYFPTLQA